MIRWLLGPLALLAAPARADELRPGAVHFVETAPGAWDLSWKQPLAARGAAALVVPDLPANCRFASVPARRLAPLALLGHARVRCEGSVAGRRIGWRGVTGRGDALLRVAPLGKAAQSYRLSAETPSAVVARTPAAMQVARTYFGLGVRHILSGWDHLLFVIALVLLVARPARVVAAATAFTLAHSLTLAAVTLGYAGLPQRPVEALIALSIVFLALELARGEAGTLARRLPWAVAFAFGLLHGFGFAAALHAIGLPEGEVPTALVGFNLGVEAGQLAVIAAVLALVAGLDRFAARRKPLFMRASAYAIGITGAYWLIARSLA